METGFVAVFREHIAQLGSSGGLHQTRQRANHLTFGRIEVGEFVEVEILERGKPHCTPLRFRGASSKGCALSAKSRRSGAGSGVSGSRVRDRSRPSATTHLFLVRVA